MPQCSEALLLFFFRGLCRKELALDETLVWGVLKCGL
jgi:hypothetical protein